MSKVNSPLATLTDACPFYPFNLRISGTGPDKKLFLLLSPTSVIHLGGQETLSPGHGSVLSLIHLGREAPSTSAVLGFRG